MPADVAVTPEQRILEQAQRLTSWGAVTGWAALRWRGAAYFDGTTDLGRTLLPVPLVVGLAKIRPTSGSVVSQEQIAPHERVLVEDVWCTTSPRALFDEVRTTRQLRKAVVMVDMAAAAKVVAADAFAAYLEVRSAWTGVPFARSVAALASDDSRSPQESRMRLCWLLDAELPPPVCNHRLFDRTGALIGVPDLFDPVAGLVGEYDGAHHRSAKQHRDDNDREQLFRDHGLEYFTVVEGDLTNRWAVAQRMHRVRSRARFPPPEDRSWVLGGPMAA